MGFLIGTVEEFKHENGFGMLRFDDGTRLRFDITASSFQPREGARIRAHVAPSSAGTQRVLRVLPVPSLSDVTTLQSDDDVAHVMDLAEADLAANGPSPKLRAAVAEIEKHLPVIARDATAIKKRIRAFYLEMPGGTLAPGEPFSDGVRADLEAKADARAPFDALLAHASSASGSKPSAKWLKEAAPIVRGIGEGSLEDTLGRWFAFVQKPSAVVLDPNRYTYAPPLSEATSDTLKGLVWITSLIATPRIASAVGDLASTCFKKIPNYGAMSSKVGNACLWALGAMSSKGIHGVAQLGRLKMRVRYAQALKLVDKALADAALRAGMSSEELLELGVPTCGLDAEGVGEEEIGGATVRVTLGTLGDVTVTWIRADGKTQTSVPTEVKADPANADDLKALKARVKDIDTLLPAQAARIEQMMSEPRDIPIDAFEERYLNHGLVANIARRLVWWVGDVPAIFQKGELVDVHGKRVDPSGRARLWHPLGRPLEEVVAWRTFIAEHGITQPFKQAHREIYVLTDAELATDTYSNRFAAHVLKQHQFAALLRERGWSYTLQGGWDSANTPFKRVKPVRLIAEFFVDADWATEEVTEAGIFRYVTTDQVRFTNDETREAVPLREVPALVFSETMRDVDLFVGVASVGNDPSWRDGGPAQGHAYWHAYAFGELGASAEMRRAVLETLIPKLKIKDRLRLDGRFLHVRGDLRSYKIHLGSTNIMMDPNDQYLCIVPGRGGRAGPEALVLPFEGDTALSIILSKALMLAADTKIKDASILNQIKG